ncbi:MAG TPA: transporter [Nitrospiraceae bacterium]|nr:transporter [Nitrospiraceae bacterium]
MSERISTFAFIVLCLLAVGLSLVCVPSAQASCGSVTCFVVIGSQQQVSPKDLLTVNLFYNYTPQNILKSGTTGVIPGVNVQSRQMILDHHQELRTFTQMVTLDLNYGISDRFGIEVAIPYKMVTHHHIDGLGEDNGGAGTETRFTDSGIGDIFVNLKYNMLPTLTSMVVTGFGVYLPTGAHQSADPSGTGVMEPTIQIGRGQIGLQGSIYATKELIPHRLNLFSNASYRHTFRNNFGYQFGDQYDLSGGVNLVTVPWLVLSTQINYRYMVHDSCNCSLARSQTPSDPTFPGEAIVIDPNVTNRPVPTTGSTYLAVTPGFSINMGSLVDYGWAKTMQVYFFSQLPVQRDFNGNLMQGVSYLGGITKYFSFPSS